MKLGVGRVSLGDYVCLGVGMDVDVVLGVVVVEQVKYISHEAGNFITSSSIS